MTYPDFSTGEPLQASDLDAIGLWLVKSQTIGSGVSSVTVTGAFSADYENYKIIVSGGVASTTCDIQLQLGSTTTGYYFGILYNTYGSPSTSLATGNSNGPIYGYLGAATTGVISAEGDVFAPNLAKLTTIRSAYISTNTVGAQGACSGFVNDTTQYTAFTIKPSSGTLTGGTIRVYGYRN